MIVWLMALIATIITLLVTTGYLRPVLVILCVIIASLSSEFGLALYALFVGVLFDDQIGKHYLQGVLYVLSAVMLVCAICIATLLEGHTSSWLLLASAILTLGGTMATFKERNVAVHGKDS